MKKSCLLFAVMLVMISFNYCQAQVNSHYWSHQYGAKGLLLNGSIIASVNDETAMFYNPGAMGLTEEFGISLSLITPSYSYQKTTDFLGEGTSFSDEGLGLAPGLVAAVFQPFDSKRITIGVTSFQRYKAELNTEDRVIKPVLNSEDQIFLGDLDFNRRLRESWFGLGIAIRLSDKFALGLTQFFTFRNDKLRIDFKKEIIDKDNPANLIAGWRSDFNYNYSVNGGALTKFGLSWQPSDVKFGLTFTTNTYAVIHTSADYAFDDQKIFGDGTNNSSSNDRSVDLMEYVTPWSAGVGFVFPINESMVSISSEYFVRVNKYNFIDDVDDPLDGTATNPELKEVKIGQSNQSVVNVGLGVERNINDSYIWYYGFRTDFSPRNLFDLGEGVSFLASTPDTYHVSTGLSYLYKKSQFSVGIDWGFGFKTGGQQLTDITHITLDNIFEFSGEDNVNTSIHQVSLYITYNL